MNELKKKELLIKSLNFITLFYIDVNYVNSSSEFIEIYNRNLISLKEISKKTKNIFLNELIEQYPSINFDEVEQYIKFKKGDQNITSVLSGDFWSQLLNLLGSRDNIFEIPFEDKIKNIVNLNEKISQILKQG
jgi:hypothetical protein